MKAPRINPWLLIFMALTIATPPTFIDLADATLASNQPAKASVLKSLSNNAKHGAVRKETIYMGFFRNGDFVPLPVSPVDGYEYGQSEVQYLFRQYSTRAPGVGFSSGQKTAPSVSASQPANTYYLLNDVEDSTGLVALTDSYYKQDGAETVRADGIVKVYCFCQRADQTLIAGTVGAPGGPIAGTLPDPTLGATPANLYGDLWLRFLIPDKADYLYGALNLLADLEKNRISTALTAAMGTGDATIQVGSSAGFAVGDYIAIQQEILLITGPGTVGSEPSSTTWNVTRAQKLSTLSAGSIADVVIRLTEVPFHWSIAAGYTLDRAGEFYQVGWRPGRMRVLYLNLQLFGANYGATNLLEGTQDWFAFEPVVPGTLPGLRVADGHHALLRVFGDLVATDPAGDGSGYDAAAPLVFPPETGSIGIVYAYTANDDGSAGGAPVGSDLKGQLYIDGGGALGPVFTIPDGGGGEILTSALGAPSGPPVGGLGYSVGDLYNLRGGDLQAQIRVDTVDAVTQGITAYTLMEGGSGYVAGETYSLDGEGGGALGAITASTVSASGRGATGIFLSGAQLGKVAGRSVTVKIQQVGSTTPGRNLTIVFRT